MICESIDRAHTNWIYTRVRYFPCVVYSVCVDFFSSITLSKLLVWWETRMARALYFTLFCVFQVMSAVTHVLAAPTHNLTSAASETFLTPIMGGDTILDPRGERDHGKRSLNVHPFEEKYLSTTHYTLEVHRDGTVRASRALKPEWGKCVFI